MKPVSHLNFRSSLVNELVGNCSIRKRPGKRIWQISNPKKTALMELEQL